MWQLPRVKRLMVTLGTPKLSVIMSILFVCLSIPILIFILIYNYRQNSEAISATLDQSVAKTIESSIESAGNFVRPVGGTLQLLAGFAAVDPAYFRTEASADLLYRAVISAEQIDAAYVSFEDGYHRVVTRMDEDRRRFDPKIPANANWHSSFIDDFSVGMDRARHRTFFDTWGHRVGGYSVPTSMDIRALDGYAESKIKRNLVISDPAINPDTGGPIIFLRYPIFRDGEFIGAATANITMDFLSRYLASHRASPNSKSLIADRNSGKIIAASDPQLGVHIRDGKISVATLDAIGDPNVKKADMLRTIDRVNSFFFESPVNGDEISATFTDFPGDFGKSWEIINLTPTSDFVGNLKKNNRQMVLLIAGLTLLELMLIYALSTRLSRPIEDISRELKSVESLSFKSNPFNVSNIKEIAQLQSATSLLRNSLQSFASFVPLDVVRELVRTGTPLTLGVEQRFLTVMFTDIENFSSHAERMPADELLGKMSVYFEEVSRAVAQEGGTVDKFIGDGVMAFWGAPVERPDHALRACAAALRASRRMNAVNDGWAAQGGAQMRIRVGLHSADVLVGNVGSTERLSYTVMGDGVNVAARLEGINKNFGTSLCVSESVKTAAGPSLLVRPICEIQVKGRVTALMTYEPLGIAGESDAGVAVREEGARLAAMTWEAWDCLARGDFVGAERGYGAVLQAFPGDPVARYQLDTLRTSQFEPLG